MRTFALFAALALLAGGANAQNSAQAPAPTAVPRVDYHVRVLANGLKVFSVLDRHTPNVTVQVWYGVGSKDDPAGRSGFAHMFEHLMFKGAHDMPSEYMDRLTEDVGGANNASTADDYTEYHEVVPANHLQRLLWAESERMGGLVVDQADFQSERQVVEEELRQRVLADPYGRLFSLALPEATYTTHPYHRPGIGSIADLDASTVDDVRAFHAVYYRPDNANLIVIGNFDPAQLDAWVDRYFGAIARPDIPLPRVTAVEPPRTGPKHYDAYGPNVPLPAVAMTWLIPPAASRDATVLQVIDAILTTGKSSRLYQSLVYNQQIAQSVLSEADLHQQAGLFAVGAVMAAGKTPDQGEEALRAELKRLRDLGVTAAEVSQAKNQLFAAILRNRETVEGRGAELGSTIVLEGDAARVNSDVIELQGITAADVQRVARRYLADDRRTTIRYRDEGQRPTGQTDVLVQDSPQVAAAPLKAPAVIPVVELLPEGRRQPPPAPTAPVTPIHSEPVEQTLANGLRVIVAKVSDLPVFTASLTVRSGAALDPEGLAGLADVTADLLPQGTTSRSATDIAAQTEALGGTLNTGVGYDSSQVTLSGLADTLPQALPIMADVVRHPAFAQEELDRLRLQDLDQLTLALQDPGSLGRLAMARVVFGDGPYGRPTSGSPQSLGRITRGQVIAQYQRLYRPDNAVLVLSGDISPQAGFALARQAFGDWANPAGAPPGPAADRPSPGGRVVVIDLPGTGQAAVSVGGRSIPRKDPDFYAVKVANGILGGGYSARLNEEIRVKRGLSYGANSELEARHDIGVFEAQAQTKNEAADQVAGLLMDEVRRLGTQAATPAELAARKATLIGEYGRNVDTGSGLAGAIALDALYGVDLGEIARYSDRVQAVGAEGARAAAVKLVDPAKADLVIVGDAKLFLPAVKQRYPNVEVIPAGRFDLDSATLVGAAP
jgi:zinc protease